MSSRESSRVRSGIEATTAQMELTTLAAEAPWNKDESLHDLVYLGKSDNRKRLKVVNYSKERKHPQPLNSKLEKQIIPETERNNQNYQKAGRSSRNLFEAAVEQHEGCAAEPRRSFMQNE